MPDSSAQPRHVGEAAQRIGRYIHHTPVATANSLDSRAGATLFCKCENLQRSGAFKLRGALNAVLQRADSGPFVTHSSGNHGAALSLAAALCGQTATVVVPENSSQVKVDAIRSYGGKIVFCSAELADREATVAKLMGEGRATLIHPYDDADIIAGQGTAALELLQEVPDLDFLVTPVGGGGLLSGSALATRFLATDTQVVGVEPAAADDAWRSLRSGRLESCDNPATIADGLRASLGPSTFQVIKAMVGDILLVSESQIVAAMRFFWQRMKLIIEPSAAVALAGVLFHPDRFQGARVGVILSGGNIDLDKLPW